MKPLQDKVASQKVLILVSRSRQHLLIMLHLSSLTVVERRFEVTRGFISYIARSLQWTTVSSQCRREERRWRG